MPSYRVVDVRANVIDPTEIMVEGARSPEEAARQVVGHPVVRSGAKKDLVARVYWQPSGSALTMVRLYKTIDE